MSVEFPFDPERSAISLGEYRDLVAQQPVQPDRPVRTSRPNAGVLAVSNESMGNWRDYAACRDTDPGLFYPNGTTGPALEQAERAKAVCMECESRQPCLEYAISIREQNGIWGGTTEEERRKMFRTARVATNRTRSS